MTRDPVPWRHSLRAVAVACVLVLVVLFVAGNFVLVDVRLWALTIEVRLAWAVVVPAGLCFAAGVRYGRLTDGPSGRRGVGPGEEPSTAQVAPPSSGPR